MDSTPIYYLYRSHQRGTVLCTVPHLGPVYVAQFSTVQRNLCWLTESGQCCFNAALLLPAELTCSELARTSPRDAVLCHVVTPLQQRMSRRLR